MIIIIDDMNHDVNKYISANEPNICNMLATGLYADGNENKKFIASFIMLLSDRSSSLPLDV